MSTLGRFPILNQRESSMAGNSEQLLEALYGLGVCIQHIVEYQCIQHIV